MDEEWVRRSALWGIPAHTDTHGGRALAIIEDLLLRDYALEEEREKVAVERVARTIGKYQGSRLYSVLMHLRNRFLRRLCSFTDLDDA